MQCNWILLMQGSRCFTEEKKAFLAVLSKSQMLLVKKDSFFSSSLVLHEFLAWNSMSRCLVGSVWLRLLPQNAMNESFRSQHLVDILLRIEASDNVRTQLSLSDTVYCSPSLANTCPDLSDGLRFLHESGIAGCRQRKRFVDTPQQYIIHCFPDTLFHLQ